MPNDQFARPVEIDWFAAAADLKALQEAEFRERPTLPEYKDRYPSADIPLLALDVEPHEISGSEPIGRWCLNHGRLDQFSGEFLQIALNVGSGLSFKPVNIDALAFLFHTLSLFLVATEDLQQTGSRYLKLLRRPLADGRVIQVRQILSLIKATELLARECGIAAKLGRPPIDMTVSPGLPWLLVKEDEDLRPGFVGYPQWIFQPDGRHRTVPTREEHARLFTEDWLTRNIVTTLPNSHGDPNASEHELPAATPPTLVNGKNKPGPQPDIKTARKVADIVAREAPGQRWQDKLDDICEALDEEEVRCPKTWAKRELPILSWSDGTLGPDRELAKKAIAHHLANSRKL
jgi:hypothetical protein